jgi:transketolase
VRATKEIMGFDPDEAFAVPDEVRAHMAGVAERGEAEQRAWQGRFDAWSEAFPALRRDWELDLVPEPREGWRDALPVFPAGEDLATRDAGKQTMAALRPFTPTMIGGAGDLVESTKTEFAGSGVFSATHAGRNVAFGIREHAMGSIVNGIALEPQLLKPFGSTFLVFSDYMRPAVRLSALMELENLWIWTHDSIGLGEDGPTHQPVEHHMALRAIPNLWYVRPADANETVTAWRLALERKGGPVALALTRQKVPTFDRSEVAPADGVLRGAYTLWQSAESEPDLLLLATGSEVAIALGAARAIGNGAVVRVVSMPCWELFAEQPEEYRDEVLPPGARARVSIEAGVTHGWERWVGDHGVSIGVDRFGASAPYQRIYEELGLTPENVAAKAEALLARVG